MVPRAFCPVLLALLLCTQPDGRGQVVISEFMAQNVNSAQIDEDGQHEDWLELHNTGSTTVSLNGWYLSDDAADLRKWRFPVTTPAVNLAPGARLVVWCSGKNRKAAVNRLHTNFKLDAAGEYLGLTRSDGFTIEHQYAPAYPPQFNNSVYGLANSTTQQELLPETASGKAKVATSLSDFQTNFAGWNSSPTFNDSSWQAGQSGFGYDVTSPAQNIIGPLIGPGGNMQATMNGVNASCFVRYIINVPTPATVASLVLRMKYDDGYIAYLNGTQVASSLAPGSPQWNSSAIIDRSDGQAANFETASLVPNAQTLLVPGDNVLAFQMRNSSASATATLLRPLLLANVITGTQTGYLATATPGLANSAVTNNFGPAISQVTDQPPQPVGGAGSVPLLITAKIVPTLRPLAASNPVVLKYRVMYGTETSLVMNDAGTGGDVAAGDGIWSVQVPTTALAAGQMLRWRVEARDNANIYSYEPPYPFSVTSPPSNPPPVSDAADLDQYFGTVALNPALATSQLPVLHWFTNDAANTRTTTGASCSFFYLDRFYDNVRVELHGQSSAGFPVNKKSHNVNFTKINRFRWNPTQPRVRSMNLLTNYADKTKLRNQLAWDAWEASGHLMSHWCAHVRVEQNAQFWGIYDMVEDGNEDMLDRYGRNPYDALYKIYDSMDSISGAEQKTREDVDTSKADYQALLNGLATTNAISARRLYAYDNVDVPAIINALAVHALINNNDWGHKNYYMYRHTTGSGEWSILPWDQDLSSGHTWISAQSYFNDEIDSQRTIRNGANNRLKQLVYDSPEMNKMFVRRMRTLMDEFFVSGTSTTGWYEARIPGMLDKLDPALGGGQKSDQQLDFEKWGFWVHGSSAAIAFTDSRAPDHTIRAQPARLSTANPIPPYVGSTSSGFGTNTTYTFLNGRRRYLYNLDGQNPASGADLIPAAQPATPTGLSFEVVDFNTANVDQQYFIIKNTNTSWIDLSGWKITGPDGSTTGHPGFVFPGGTVIPAFTGTSAPTASGDVHTGRLHVVRDAAAFRARTASPKGGEYRQVAGPFSGRLAARGGTLELRNKADQIVATTTWAGNPTAAQNTLRITELHFIPAPPTLAEAAALPGVQASDFEFVELINAGAAPLVLTGAQFDKGITFTFPTFTLAAGARCVIVANLPAFQLRHGTGHNVAGEFEGSLDNGGERLQLFDAAGQEVLDFTYDANWYGVPNPLSGDGIGGVPGYSIVTRSDAPAFDAYGAPLTWRLAGAFHGSPGAGDSSAREVFLGWRHDHFTTEEQATLLAAPGGDPDGDNRSNFAEYAHGSDPRTAENTALLARAQVEVAGVRYPAVRFPARANTLDLAWLVEASEDGVQWRTLAPSLATATPLSADLNELTWRDSLPASAGSRTFRVRAQYLTTYETGALTVHNHAPVATADAANVRAASVTIAVLANDSDADNDPLTVRSVGTPAHGTVVLNADNTITYTPGGTFVSAGGDGFTYVVGDEFGGETQGTVTLALSNFAPAAVADTANAHAAPVPIAVLANDTDADSDPLSITGFTQGQHGSVAQDGGVLIYTPGASFGAAAGDAFTYTIADGYGGTATGTVTINKVNTAPTAGNDAVIVRPGPITIAVLGNDGDVENDPLTLASVSTPAHGSAVIDGGTILYTANATFPGSDSFTYTITDGYGGSATGTVLVTNTTPAAVNDFARVTSGAAVLVPVLANDSEPDAGQSLTVTLQTAPPHGTAGIEGGAIRYTPGATFAGTDAFSYAISDGFGGTATATVTLVDELLAAVPGNYLGLVGGGAEPSTGIVQVKLGKKASFTGQLWHLGERHKVKGVFDPSGAAAFTVASKGGALRQVTLQLEAARDGMSGSLNDGTSTYATTLRRVEKLFGKKNPHPQAGTYTALLPVDPAQAGQAAYPQGRGWAIFAVGKSGSAKITGKLGDDTGFVVKAVVDAQGRAVLHTPLYQKPPGFLAGEIAFVTGDAAADNRGTLTWRKPSPAKAGGAYPAGFAGATAWQAARYTAPAANTPIFGFNFAAATATLTGGGLAGPVSKTVTLLGNRLVVANPSADILTLKYDRKSGRLTGSYIHPLDGKKRDLSGVLYQKLPAAGGVFGGVDAGGQPLTGGWLLAPP
jgi:P pilus assembly chaperone PapD